MNPDGSCPICDKFGCAGHCYPKSEPPVNKMKIEHAEQSIDNSMTGLIAVQRERIDKLEAFIEAVADIYPNLENVYKVIYNPSPRRIVGQMGMSSEQSADRIGNLERSLMKSAKRAEELETTIYDLQMADSHLEFISRVQDAGLHHEWDNFMEALEMVEKQIGETK